MVTSLKLDRWSNLSPWHYCYYYYHWYAFSFFLKAANASLMLLAYFSSDSVAIRDLFHQMK